MSQKSNIETQAWERAKTSLGNQLWTSIDLAKYLVIGIIFGTCIGVLVCQALS
jgi:hypothetical protein